MTRRDNGLRLRNHLRIATINASTFNGKEKEGVLLMEGRRLDIMGVCEARYKGQGVKRLHNDYVMIYKGKEEEARHGVAIIMRPEIYRRVIKVTYVNEKVLA